MKPLLTGIAIAAFACAVSPAFAQNHTTTRDRMDRMYDNATNDVKDNWDDMKTVNNKEDLKRWLDDKKHDIDQKKKDLKTDLENRKRDLKAQGGNNDDQIRQAEQDYKDKTHELDLKKDRLEEKYKQRMDELNNKNNNY